MSGVQIEFRGLRPRVDAGAYVAPTAVLIGDVTVEAGASIWFGAVLRADYDAIVIGRGSNVQDNCVLHTSEGYPTVLGSEVTLGHAAVLESCRIESRALIGMGAVVLSRAVVGEGTMVAAGSVVVEDAAVPPGVLVAGAPAQVKRPLSGSAQEWVGRAAREYHDLREAYQRHASIVTATEGSGGAALSRAGAWRSRGS